MSYSIPFSKIKTLGLASIFNKFEYIGNSIQDYISKLYQYGLDKPCQKTIDNINIILNAARKSFKKAKFVIDLEDTGLGYDTYSTFIDIKTGNIDYKQAFVCAFSYAAILYLKHVSKNPFIDTETIAILSRDSIFMDFEVEDNVKDFDELVNAMLNTISGKDITSSTKVINYIMYRDAYLIYLLMPRLNVHITNNHRAIYNAFITGDVAAFEAILDAV